MKVRSVLSPKKWKDESRQPLRFNQLKIGGVALLFSLTMLLLSACTNPLQGPVKSGTPQPGVGNVTPTFMVTPTATPSGPTITFSSTGCPSTLPAINWDELVGTKAGVNKVQKVSCGTFEGGALAALVNVRYYLPDAKMDFYIYDNLTGTPAKRFEVQGLIGGDAQISPTGTIMTAENPNNDVLGVNLFKEYQWNGSGYVQILFPGMYPYMTHYQAEQAQAGINAQLAQTTATPTAKSSIWQNSAFSVVSRMALDVFHWSSTQNSIVTYNTPSSTYIIQTTNLGPGGGGFITTLFRLDNVATNMFEVKQVTSLDGTVVLSSPPNDLTQPLTSPLKVSGSYNSSGTLLGRVVVYNDTYRSVGDTGAIHGSASTGAVSFAPSVSYSLDSKGMQEGLVAFFVTNQNNIVNSNQVVLAKVFLSA